MDEAVICRLVGTHIQSKVPVGLAKRDKIQYAQIDASDDSVPVFHS
jgi:hypothetical protein